MKSSQRSHISMGAIRDSIRSTGLRSTMPRVAVLSYLQGVATPLSHAEIFDALEEQGFDRATIYRNLVDLTEVGLLIRTDVGDHVWRFELRRTGQVRRDEQKTEHPHFMCTDCGDVACLPEMSVSITSAAAVPRSVRSQQVEVQLKGLCDRCA